MRTIVITGTSDGIGAAAARQLAETDARLVLVGRSPETTQAVAEARVCSTTWPTSPGSMRCAASRLRLAEAATRNRCAGEQRGRHILRADDHARRVREDLPGIPDTDRWFRVQTR